jgi:ABC-type lipoprotein export system ATPase subunit
MTAIEIADLFRVYSSSEGQAAALQGLSLRVEEGEVVTVLGPSGSGKTTLLRILAGLDRPSAGTVRVHDLDVGRLAPRRLYAYRAEILGYVEQHYAQALAPELTARELVALRLGLAGIPRRERLLRADALLERVGLLGRRAALPSELSGGEQQRVAVCAALAHRPRVLLADEPTGELDRETAGLVYGLLGDLVREEGCTAVVVSHDPRSAEIADRAVQVRDGRVSGEWAREQGGEEAIVVGRGGWVRLPEEYLLRAGIGLRAGAAVDEGRIVIRALGEPLPTLEENEEPLQEESLPLVTRRVASLQDVAKTYGQAATATHVFKRVRASFGSGRFYAVTGRSGSGKTTLLNLLAGLELPTEGEVEILGIRVSSLNRAERAAFRREHVGLVGQQPGLVPFLSAEENIGLALALRGVKGGEADERIRAGLAAVGLEDRANDRVAHLSMGERVRVAVARALAPRPALVLADEPTARLDQANAVAVAALFSRLAREHGTAVVCATHDPLAIEQADEELSLAGVQMGAASGYVSEAYSAGNRA